MSVSVSQDESRPEGGFAVLRFPDVSVEIEGAYLLFQPLDESLSDMARWPRDRIEAVETRLKDGALEVVVGPEAVNGLPAYTAVQVTLTGIERKTGEEFDLKTECRWPALMLQQQRRRRRLPDVVQPTITEPLAPRTRRPQYQSPSAETAERPELSIKAPDRPQPEAPREYTRQSLLEPDASETATTEDPAEPAERETDPAEQETKKEDAARELRPLAGETGTGQSQFGRNAPPPPARSGFLLPALIALLVGIAIGGLGYHFAFSTPDGGTVTLGDGSTEAGAADRTLMEALDSSDTTEDNLSIFRTSKDDLWVQASDKYQERDFPAAAQNYRMAARVALRESSLPNLLRGLGGALDASETTKPEAARLSRLLFTLSALAGDPEAFCRLANSYGTSDPAYAQRLRDRARALGGNNTAAQGC